MSMQTTEATLATLLAKVQAISERLDRHDAEHSQIARIREAGGERAKAAEAKLWDGIDDLRRDHEQMLVAATQIKASLAVIQASLDMADNPIVAAVKVTKLEQAVADLRARLADNEQSTRVWLATLGAALALVVSATTGLIGSIVQAIGGHKP